MSIMKTYIGTKVINAAPMNRQEYNDYRGWQLPADENGADDGFLVEYVDGGRANDSRHVGYISWSPKDVFERAYKPMPGAGMPSHQQRVVQEHAELSDRLIKLDAFITDSPIFKTLPEAECARLQSQSKAMAAYLSILSQRIAAF